MAKRTTKQRTKRSNIPKKIKAGENSVTVVGVGASAGGLEALLKFFKKVPERTGLAFVVVQHLDPKQPSLSVEIIARSTRLPIQEVKSGTHIRPDEIYVVPPNSSIEIVGQRLKLSPRKKWPASSSAIDFFFTSLAKAYRRKAIGILLSGTGHDGTAGLQAIKKYGGRTFAQLPSSAKYQGMPQSAIDAGTVDFVFNAENIVSQLLAGTSAFANAPSIRSKPHITPNSKLDPNLEKIFDFLRSKTKIDFAEYKQSTIKRRIQRRMAIVKIKDFGEYNLYLHEHSEEVHTLYNDILINVTEFFRDPDSFKALRKNVFPALLKNKPQRTAVRIWVPGCSTGEEAYSIAIALTEYMQEIKRSYPVQIFATDISEAVIQKARSGLFEESISSNVSKKRLETFFEKTDKGYKISKMIRDLCLFSKHDVTSDPPFAKIDLISCRNVLIYFTAALQRRVLPIFHYALRPEGFLWLGQAENPGEFSKSFSIIDKKQKIYLKSNLSTPLKFNFPSKPSNATPEQVGKPQAASSKFDFEAAADELILSKYAPPSVVVNSEMEVLQFRGQTFPFLVPIVGKPSLNLLKMVRADLLAGLRRALQTAKVQNKFSARKGLFFDANGKTISVDIEIAPMNPKAPLKDRTYLIMFKQNGEIRSLLKDGARKLKGKRTAAGEGLRMRGLIAELSELKDFQQSLIDQYEASQEELIAANEELQSTNEEFLSANEEIETSKEELQSTNEELITVNDELQARNINLTTLSSDLNNLLASVEIPVLIVGSDYKIRIFSPKAKSAFNLIPGDVGRPISDIKSNFNIDLDVLVGEVLETLTSKEIEVQDQKGIWYRIQIRPYRTIDNRIDGAVIAVIDINYLKQKELRTKENLQYIKSILFSVPLPLVVINRQFQLRSPNPSFLNYFQLKSDVADYNIFNVLKIDKKTEANLRTHLIKSLNENVPLSSFKVACEVPAMGLRKVLLSAGRVHQDTDDQEAVLISFVDVTEATRAEENQKLLLQQEQESAKKANAANQEKDQFLATLSHELRTPLSSILAWAQLISDGKVDLQKARFGASVIERSAKIQTQLINDLLEISRITAGKLSLTISPINPLTDVRSAIESVKPMADAKSIQIVSHLGEEDFYILGDSVRLQQIVWNLLTNAIKFSPKNSVVDVIVQLTGNSNKRFVEIIVADNGKGVPEEFLEKIFQRFSQADSSSTRVHGGLGIGLSIVHHLVHLQGGKIKAENAKDKSGAIFTVRFPLISLEKSQAVQMSFETSTKNSTRNEQATASPDLSGLRILFVDDDETAREAICIYLKSFGAEIVCVSSAKAAFEELLNFHPHCLVSDISMPEEDGYSFIHRVRQLRHSEGGNIPALALTANASNEDRSMALEAGFQAHLAKPVAADQLGQLILQICR